MQGTPADLAKSGVDFADLVAEDVSTENDETSEWPWPLTRQMSSISSRSMNTSNSVSVSSLDIVSADGSLCAPSTLDDEQETGVGMEASSKGKVKGSVAVNYFTSGANWFCLSVLGVAFLITQLLASAADYWVAIW